METQHRDMQVANVVELCRDVREMLGPFGMGKLVVDEGGHVTVTSSASVFLDELDLSDPGLTLTATAARDFRDKHGDGAGSVITVTGALLSEAERLEDLGLHPTTIADGYRRALAVATEAIADATSPADASDVERVAVTALTGTRDPSVRAAIGEFIADATADIAARGGGVSDVGVTSRLGAAHAETELVEGVVVDAEPVARGMPRQVTDGGVAVLTDDVDVEAVGTATSRRNTVEVTMEADSYDDVAEIADDERASFDETVSAAVDAGCRCIVTSGTINDRVKTRLATAGVLAIQKVDDDEASRIARATGATAVPSLESVTADALGRGDVSVSRKSGRDMTIVRGTDGGVYTLFCRAPDPRSVAAFEDSVEGAIAAVDAARESGVVPGGGAVEMQVAARVRAAGRSHGDREQLAMEAFADAVEAVPRTLARNAGLDSTDTLTRIRSRHEAGDRTTGVDALFGEVVDVEADAGILDAATLKRSVFGSATDLAVQLVRIDDVVSATDVSDGDEPTVDSRVGDAEGL